MRSLLHTFAFGIWAMRPEAVGAYMPQVQEIMMGRGPQTTTQTEKELMLEAGLCFYCTDGRRLDAGVDEIVPEMGMVAVMHVNGPIMKNDFCGAPGTATLSRWMAQFEATKEIEGVLLLGDSPGGSGTAMHQLCTQMGRMTKPTATLVDHGQACSAMYGIACASDLVFTSSEQDEIGSIGTYVRLVDWKGAYEKAGVKFHEIYATRSGEKNGWVREAFKADPTNADDDHYKAIREQYIDPFNESFINLVQKNRPGVKDENGVLSGRVFSASDALKHGLIDSTGQTLEGAIAAVRALATKTNN